MRICSLLPSATEIVYALGLGDQLYGISHESDYPPDAAATKPTVTPAPERPSSVQGARVASGPAWSERCVVPSGALRPAGGGAQGEP